MPHKNPSRFVICPACGKRTHNAFLSVDAQGVVRCVYRVATRVGDDMADVVQGCGSPMLDDEMFLNPDVKPPRVISDEPGDVNLEIITVPVRIKEPQVHEIKVLIDTVAEAMSVA